MTSSMDKLKKFSVGAPTTGGESSSQEFATAARAEAVATNKLDNFRAVVRELEGDATGIEEVLQNAINDLSAIVLAVAESRADTLAALSTSFQHQHSLLQVTAQQTSDAVPYNESHYIATLEAIVQVMNPMHGAKVLRTLSNENPQAARLLTRFIRQGGKQEAYNKHL